MARVKLLGWVVMWLGLAVGVVLGFAVAYVVHVQLHFFGATHVDFGTIMGLWIGCPLFIGFGGAYLGAIIGERL